MDLSFARFHADHELDALPADLSLLLVGIAARQAASRTAAAQAALPRIAPDERLLRPLGGAFNGPAAALLMRWKDE